MPTCGLPADGVAYPYKPLSLPVYRRLQGRDTVSGMPLRSAVLRTVVATVVPESASLNEAGWNEFDCVIEALLHDRPESLKRQLRLFLSLIEWLPLVRYGRRFTALDPARRTRVLNYLQNAAVEKVRVGFWGLRTIVLAGYYGRPQAASEIGYSASVSGWEALK